MPADRTAAASAAASAQQDDENDGEDRKKHRRSRKGCVVRPAPPARHPRSMLTSPLFLPSLPAHSPTYSPRPALPVPQKSTRAHPPRSCFCAPLSLILPRARSRQKCDEGTPCGRCKLSASECQYYRPPPFPYMPPTGRGPAPTSVVTSAVGGGVVYSGGTPPAYAWEGNGQMQPEQAWDGRLINGQTPPGESPWMGQQQPSPRASG